MISSPTNQLPNVLFSKGWKWKHFFKDNEFWVGEDLDEKKWLLKGRGSFYALREKSFSFLSQRLGINTQSSTYLILEDDNKFNYSGKSISKYQLAIEYLDEHNFNEKKCTDCPFKRYELEFNEAENKIIALINSDLPDALDWVRVDMLAYICGANEPSDRLFTKDHRIYTIDNEQMFVSEPVELLECDWFDEDRELAMKISIELCKKLAKITNDEILTYTTIPDQYHVKELWSINNRIKSARDYAIKFCDIHA